MTTNFPNAIDTDNELPPVSDNITETGSVGINSLRSAMFATEIALGTNPQGTSQDVSTRLSISLNDDGTLRHSALVAAGLLALPVRNAQIGSDAAIDESKLNLFYPTSNLKNLIDTINASLTEINSFIEVQGAKISPHIDGSNYRHELSAIDVDLGMLRRVDIHQSNLLYQTTLRDTSNALSLVSEVSNDLLDHVNADHASNTTAPPQNQAHNASGIHLNTDNFTVVPRTKNDVQQFADFIDSSNISTIGTRIQTLYSNGIPRNARATALLSDSGQNIIPLSAATTYLLNGGASAPVDSIDSGDDVITFNTSSSTSNNFDAAFSQIKPGDTATVSYPQSTGAFVTVSFLIKEKKAIVSIIPASGGNPSSTVKTFAIRINGKNLVASSSAQVKIDKGLFSNDKSGVLALAQAPVPSSSLGSTSLTVANPRGASVLSIGFNPDLLDSSHYNLYLQFFPTGNPTEQAYELPRIDVTGNAGATPGAYTLESTVESINKVFRSPGYNYRFIAYSYKGELGIMLADAIGGASFSIVSGIVNASGVYDQAMTNVAYSNMNSAVNVFDGKDALGFGPSAANVASPPYSISYASPTAALIPTKIFAPSTKKNYYVNGAEKERLSTEPLQSVDGYGESYWHASIVDKTIIAGARTRVTYQVNSNLTTSSLKTGKTLVVQSDGYGGIVDFGRFTIENVQFNNCNCADGYHTQIAVYDATHGTGISPYVSANVGALVKLYFSSDSVSFNTENVSDGTASPLYKRWFEIFIDQNGKTFSHERARTSIASSVISGDTALSPFEIYDVSPKLRGYSFGTIRKITLAVTSFNITTGTFSGYLCSWDGTTESKLGPVTVGKKGSVVRFYDETYIDYVDVIVNFSSAITAVTTPKHLDIQLFRSLQLDEEVMPLGSCQIDDSTQKISYLKDKRQFGNTSEEQLSTSALDYISNSTQLLSENGIVRGFDVTAYPSGADPYPSLVSVSGGVAVINGRVIQINNQNIGLPVVVESLYPAFTTTVPSITWFLCANDKAELEWVASTDFANGNSTYESLGLDHHRLFYVQNPNTTNAPYTIKATYFSNLVETYKDLTPIAIFSSTVSAVTVGSAITAVSYSDARRYISNGYQGLSSPFVLSPKGNFRTMQSAIAWLNQLVNYKSSSLTDSSLGRMVIVKGNNVISSPLSLMFQSKVTFKGEGGTINIPIATGLNLGSNVSFENVKFNYTYDATSDGAFTAANPINASSSALRITTPGGSPATPMALKNVSITKCHFVSPYNNHYAFFACNFVGESDSLENLTIEENRFDCTSLTDNGLYAGGDVQAAIAIYSSRTAAPTSATRIAGQRLINASIERNICNKNQIISIAGTSVSNANIYDAIVPIAVKIAKNVCGAINICVKQDVPMSAFSADSFQANLYREASILLEYNTCTFIFTGDAQGKYYQGVSTSAFAISRFYTPTITIVKNIVGYVHTGQRISSGYTQSPGVVEVRWNTMRPGTDTCLNPYVSAGYAPNAPPVIVESGVL